MGVLLMEFFELYGKKFDYEIMTQVAFASGMVVNIYPKKKH